MPVGMLPPFTFVLTQPAALGGLGAEPRLRALLVQGHRGAHFGAPPLQEAARARRGARPGSSVADAVFNAPFSEPLDAVKASLAHFQAGVDVAPASMAKSSQPAVDVVQSARKMAMLARGSQVNYKKAKSCAMIASGSLHPLEMRAELEAIQNHDVLANM